jgi:polyether ionophore transport system permease protein
MAVGAGAPPLAAPLRPIPLRARLYGLGSVYGKTLRDSRLAFIIMTGLIAGLMLAVGSAWGTAYSTPEARREIALLLESVPAVIAGIAGPIVKPETMGGFLTYKYGPFFAFLAGLWSILALSSTLAGEARRGSLDFVAVAPLGKRRIALEKLAAHVTAMGLSMVFLVVATLVASSVFGVAELGDEIAVAGAVGFAAWVGLMGLVSGAVAFALAPLLGRGSAAGVAGAVLLGSFFLGGYAPYVPELEPLAVVSWFHWTYGHVPLAGQYDWISLVPVALAAVVLFAVGIELFARRDLGIMTGLPIPGLPRATLGVRGPVGRAFGDQLPVALGWGIGIGFFGFMMAAVSRTFADQMIRDFPTFAEIIQTVFPGVDLASSGWFLQLLFVEMGLIVVGFAAATFVGKWASDEESGRLEVLLASPLSRARWVIAGGIGALAAAFVTTVVFAVGIAVGSAFGGSEVVTPTIGSLALFAYAAAIVGIGFAIGGLWRTGWAAELSAAFVIATFLVYLLAPALDLPEWVAQLALTAHLGQPMIGNWDWAGMALCAVIAVAGILLGAWGMARRDVD